MNLSPSPTPSPGTPALEHPGVVPYPHEVAERYRSLGLWTGQSLDSLLRRAVGEGPDRTAVIDGSLHLSYEELDEAVGRTATYLRRTFAPSRGERVVVQLPNIAEFVVIVFALFRLGVVPVFALPAHRSSELLHFARLSEAVAIVTRSEIAGFDHAGMTKQVAGQVPSVRHVLLVDELEGAAGHRSLLNEVGHLPCADTVPVSAADLAFLQLSGGTTGVPKLIPRSHDDYLYSVRESAKICALNERSRMLVAMPISHNFTMSSPGILGILHAGGALVLTQDPSPENVFALIEEHGVSIVPAVPPLAIAWLNAAEREPVRLPSWEVLQVGGAKLSASVARRMRPTLGVTLQQVFGMAEGLVNYTRLDDEEERIVSTQGLRISAEDEVRVVDEHGHQVPRGTAGHLQTRGPYTIRGYYKAPEHNATAFTADGFYRTGDIVVEDQAGYLTVVGRAKDQINRGGEKIAPEEVEDALLRHTGVHDVSVSAMPDDVLGERIQAHVVPRTGTSAPRPVELRRFLVSQGLATFKIPDVFTLVERLPGTAVGKVDRRRLASADGHQEGRNP